uniref:Uncharacterized protein n=1 Tax=Rhizophagus irregularis (strain DAOM 181602 / DAOM 197198 / MUCL 43194) TaxID=747089 RepID=U9URL2_RHIID
MILQYYQLGLKDKGGSKLIRKFGVCNFVISSTTITTPLSIPKISITHYFTFQIICNVSRQPQG